MFTRAARVGRTDLVGALVWFAPTHQGGAVNFLPLLVGVGVIRWGCR